MSLPSTEPESKTPFKSRWAAATNGDLQSLKELAVSCQSPVYAWLRASGASPEEASLRTEHFLARLHTEEPPHDEEKAMPRFNDFLIQRLIAWAKAGFPTAGTGAITSIDRARAEKRFKHEPARPPDEVFSRRWSLMIVERTLEMLRGEFAARGEGAQFPHLASFLGFNGGGEEKYAEVGPKLGMSVSVLHLAVYNFRRRYREVLRTLIADTVRTEDDLDSELTLLLCAAG